MIKYDLKLVYDYIAGNDIDKDINELENNGSFMKLVLKVSKDKKMFNFCSDNLKNDLSFIKDVADIFSYDQGFIIELIRGFIKNNIDNPFERMEAALIACKYIKDEDLLFEFIATANVLYTVTACDLVNVLEESNPFERQELGKGFMVIKENYLGYPLSTDFCAKKMLEEIFDEIPNLEVYLHTSFNNSQSLLEYGLCNFIVNIVTLKDNELSTYIMLNPHVADDIKKRIVKIIKNWNVFEQKNRFNKLDAIYSKINEYVLDECVFVSMDIDLFIYYILSKYKLENEIRIIDGMMTDKKYGKIMEYIKSGRINEDNFSDEEKRHAFYIESIIKEVMNKKVYEEKDPYVNSNAVVLTFKKNGNNKKC